MNESISNKENWPWSEDLDAIVAAPDSHIILFENEKVRVLKIHIKSRQKEPYHTHRWSSIFVLLKPARIRYYDESGKPVFETKGYTDFDPYSSTEWMGPERLHAVENIDGKDYEALRIEIKS